MSVKSSQGYCRRATRRASSSFPLAFRVLPGAKRDAMTALYAFFRLTDDLADSPGDPELKRVALANWRERLNDAIAGTPTHRCHAALAHAVRTYGIDPRFLHAVIDGVETDLTPRVYATFAELYPYCYRVASAVGLACVPVWGLRDGADRGEALQAAEAAGIAFQLTNILRDLAEDARAGRVYAPADELQRFSLTPLNWGEPAQRGAFAEFLRFQVGRAGEYYDRGAALSRHLTPEGQAIYGVMAGLYRRLLGEVAAAGGGVLTRRVSVPTAAKLRLLAAAWPVRWGWA